MDNSVITGIFTIVGAIVGSTTTFAVEAFLRKEKFKEILYKEKLILYKEITENLAPLLIEATQCVEKDMKTDELISKADSFFISVLRGRHILPKEMIKTSYNLRQHIDKLTLNNDYIEKFQAHVLKLENLIRADLGAELLSEDIKNTFTVWSKAKNIGN